MNNRRAQNFVISILLAILFNSSNTLFAGPEPLATDEKDYSKEAVPLEKSWCETSPRVTGNTEAFGLLGFD